MACPRVVLFLALAALILPLTMASTRVVELDEPATPQRGRSLRGRSLVQQANLLNSPLPATVMYNASNPQ